MRRSTSITIDDGTIDDLKDLGFSLSGFTQLAVDTLLSEGFDDFTLSLKLKMLEEEAASVEEEIGRYESRVKFLIKQKERITELRDIVTRNYEEARDNAYACSLIDKLNNIVILSGYDITIIDEKAADIITEIRKYNDEFDLQRHIDRIKSFIS